MTSTAQVESREIHAHKAVLKIRCEHFRSLISSHPPSQSPLGQCSKITGKREQTRRATLTSVTSPTPSTVLSSTTSTPTRLTSPPLHCIAMHCLEDGDNDDCGDVYGDHVDMMMMKMMMMIIRWTCLLKMPSAYWTWQTLTASSS